MPPWNIRPIDYTCDPFAEDAARLVFTSVLGDHMDWPNPAELYASMVQKCSNYCITLPTTNAEDLIAAGSVSMLGAGVASLENIAVVPAHRGEGAGRFLLGCLERKAEAAGADLVRVSSLPKAVPFYFKNGYQPTDVARPYELAKLL